MNIHVLSRRMIESRYGCFITDSEELGKHVIISITDEDMPDADIKPLDGCKSILRLKFADLCRNDIEIEGDDLILFNDGMGKRILQFINYHIKDLDTIIVHCEAGVSRSAGCAAAIAKILLNDDLIFFKKYHPNRLVYSILISEFFNNRDSYINMKGY